jgi:hypothetical protein
MALDRKRPRQGARTGWHHARPQVRQVGGRSSDRRTEAEQRDHGGGQTGCITANDVVGWRLRQVVLADESNEHGTRQSLAQGASEVEAPNAFVDDGRIVAQEREQLPELGRALGHRRQLGHDEVVRHAGPRELSRGQV